MKSCNDAGRLWSNGYMAMLVRRSFLLACVLLANTLSFLPSTATAQDTNIAAGIALAWAPVFVADEQGFFQKRGLQQKVIMFPSGRAAQEAIIGGGAAWGTVAETPVVLASINGLPVRIIGTMSTAEIFDIAATKSIGKLEDLKGKRIGFAQGTNGQVYLTRALEKAKLGMSDITPINLSPTDMVTALSNGQIDAFVWTEPHLSQAMKMGGDKFHIIRTSGIYLNYGSIVTAQPTIDSNPEALVKSLCALKDAVAYMKANKDASVSLVAKKIKMDPEIVSREWDRVQFDITLDRAAITEEMVRQAQWAKDTRLIALSAKVPDFSNVLVGSMLDLAKECK
jgi:NitT/TauT family transport system substrate-binding protein